MRKFFVAIALFAVNMVSVAQEESNPIDKFKVTTNSFACNWFVGIQGSWSNYMDGGAGDGMFDTPTWGGSLSLGKWFTPGLGLRAKLNGWDTKNNNFVPSRTIFASTDNNYHISASDYHNKYWLLTADVMFNLTNLFKGYNESRVWNLIPYLAGGVGRNCTLNHYTPVVGGGIISSWKVCTKLDITLECSYKAMSNDFGDTDHLTHHFKSSDRIFAIEAGISYRLGKTTWHKAGDTETINSMTQMEIDALNAQIADLEAENEMLRNQINSQQPQ